MKINIESLNPDEDGITHINAASKGKTKLGKSLSNFAHYPIEHTIHGHFESLEGYQYFLLTGEKFDELRYLYGYTAKQKGDEIIKENSIIVDDANFKEWMLEGLRCKLRQHRSLLKSLVESDLPIVHYNWYGKNGKYKIYYYEDFEWYTNEMMRIRKLCQDKWRNVN